MSEAETTDRIERVSTLELFFDLVFVFTITQLTGVLADDPDLLHLLRVAVLLAIENRTIPPTAGTTNVDPSFDIDLVVGSARAWTPAPSISNSLGFGGHNGSIIIGPV